MKNGLGAPKLFETKDHLIINNFELYLCHPIFCHFAKKTEIHSRRKFQVTSPRESDVTQEFCDVTN